MPDQKCTNVKSATRLDPDLPMLGQVLHNAGYATHILENGILAASPTPRLSLALIVIFHIGGGLGRKRVTLRHGDIQTRNLKKVSRVITLKIEWLQKRLPGLSKETEQNLSF